MSNDLLKQLEGKINAAIETIELSRMEITELKEQNDELESRYVDWEDRLSALIEKFEQLEDGESVEIEAEVKTSIQKVEEEEIEDVAAEEEADEDAATDEDVEEISADVDETEGSVFGTSPESFTEAPESTQHYA
ncbi:MAG: cell division protein ZapB [SAR324 cluster bacterium]|jgi:cell division protein ZapB|nr:cell division protein ZapB [SAR324 cluster bacterium]MEE3265180.1 cell division protein ZapB [SAR324 cluster bacterium]|tara:strand:- start:1344 stop:1748 length:405 start_codon:yes stop_codon:yes gene_type:complete